MPRSKLHIKTGKLKKNKTGIIKVLFLLLLKKSTININQIKIGISL